ncbi:glycerophosphodiester phosphodiesterase family protein [Nonomuraea aridisoli]|uniref:glycerophosphodiester phosphodiesterase family protein n=1 Tax=Nonomuraea aridisoli TaxID=2070368 RepID=UPI001F15BD96|nr:glycerophosphodiester phosphodiesterase family protein [Nonomuraea aridisoli]
MTVKLLLVSVTTAVALAPAGTTAQQAACPLVFGHGGYPTGANPWTRDQIRQPNHPRGVNDQKAWGADGVEGDVQLTREGTKAVMWHNTTTNGLTGVNRAITDLWWAAGSDNLQDRSIARGPYQGERVYTLRQWLDHVRSRGLVALLEIKPEAKKVLSTSAHAASGWREISDPIKERQGSQRILVYSKDAWIQGELAKRHPGLLKGSAARWTDSVAWEEPPPSWTGNTAQWQSVLGQAPPSVMTNYTKDYRAWLSGRCA